ncbi:hypothetical protein [Streptomyces sp. NPDC093071]|uniref:hypothetical protein n=1 Tax=Streptomyces sp. NPDC093071 TaxID=3366022 RepID=UPI00380E9ACD
MTTSLSVPGAQQDGSVERRLRAALRELQKTAARFSTGPSTRGAEYRAAVWALAEPWLALAETRHRLAAGSPSDQHRWRRLIDDARCLGVQEPVSNPAEPPALTRALLRALLEAERPGPSVTEIADHLRKLIADGTCPPGTSLSALHLADEAEKEGTPAPVERVRLALRDLTAEGTTVINDARRTWVAGSAAPVERPTQIAAWLRTLIQARVYLPQSPLPARLMLARDFLATSRDTGAALRILGAEKVLKRSTAYRPVVRADLPFPLDPGPFNLGARVEELRGKAITGITFPFSEVRATCRQVQVWWRVRHTPRPDVLERVFRTLITAAAYGIPRVVELYPSAPDADVRTVLRRTAITALADLPADPLEHLWRTACLAAAVLQVLVLVETAVRHFAPRSRTPLSLTLGAS